METNCYFSGLYKGEIHSYIKPLLWLYMTVKLENKFALGCCILTCSCVRKSKTAFQLSKAQTTERLKCMCSATGHFKCIATAWKGASSACWVWKQVEGARGSLSWTSCQEGRTRVEPHHCECKKKSAFQGGQTEGTGGQRNSELFCTRPHHPGLITASLLASSFLDDGGQI